MSTLEPCPHCKSIDFIEVKLIMIGKFTSDQLYAIENREGCQLHKGESLSIDKIDPQYLKENNLDRFIDGLYCTKCGIGFVPDYMLKKKNE